MVLHDGFASAMAQSLLLPAVVLVIGLVAALCFATPHHLRRETADREATAPEGVPAG